MTESKYVPLTEANSEVITPATLTANPDLRIEATWEIYTGVGVYRWEQSQNAGMRPAAVVKYRRPKPVSAIEPGPGFRLLSKDETLDCFIDDGFTLGKWWPILDNVCEFEAYRRPSGLARSETFRARKDRPRPPTGYEIVTTLTVEHEKIEDSAIDWHLWLGLERGWQHESQAQSLVGSCQRWLEKGEWCRPIVKTTPVGDIVRTTQIDWPALWATWPVLGPDEILQNGDVRHNPATGRFAQFANYATGRRIQDVSDGGVLWHRDPTKLKPAEAPKLPPPITRVEGHYEADALTKRPSERTMIEQAVVGMSTTTVRRNADFEQQLASTSTSVHGPDMAGDDVAEDLNASELFALRARGVR